ncbi:MAG: hypothetical protein ACR2FN_08895 [Chitinophagaceae bacterium]
MAENKSTHNQNKKLNRPEVITVRTWKEYLGESLLIVFSVVLALGLTELFNKLHEQQQTKEILHQLREELIENKKSAAEQYAYHQQVFEIIDSAKNNLAFAKKFLDSGKVHLNIIFPKGAILHDLNDVAWQEAKQNNVVSKIDLGTYSLLTDIYDNQQRILNFEPSLEKILISYDSRKPENLQVTLTLIHDVLYGWIVERTPGLLRSYQKAIDKLSSY